MPDNTNITYKVYSDYQRPYFKVKSDKWYCKSRFDQSANNDGNTMHVISGTHTTRNLNRSIQIGDIVKIDLSNGDMELLKMENMEKIAQEFWKIVSSEYKDYLKWKNNK